MVAVAAFSGVVVKIGVVGGSGGRSSGEGRGYYIVMVPLMVQGRYSLAVVRVVAKIVK